MSTVWSDRHIAFSRYPTTWLTSSPRSSAPTSGARRCPAAAGSRPWWTSPSSPPLNRSRVPRCGPPSWPALPHRNLSLPDVFAVPDEAGWRRGYPQSAADAPGPTPTFDEALSLACTLLNPVLQGPVRGNWDRAVASWTPPAG